VSDLLRIPFAVFGDFLEELGFRQIELSPTQVAFRHDASDTVLALPRYQPGQHVAGHHLAMFRIQLDAKGILDAQDFDRLLASAGLQQTAS
jgi:hypothetical protein